ncbi:hypothetical protein CYMTET_44502 [Cymbomonas tetramitiformis]|uniref:RNase H type-1 domain-containing protein n=1 Tax=Cymbomonas tetramitiformis TaxID=36881 RepID=A0AAE0EZ87_9CHLO|nr:hypothetical protein CYMTET_44502 [Cymbomonas tetramitiformis]
MIRNKASLPEDGLFVYELIYHDAYAVRTRRTPGFGEPGQTVVKSGQIISANRRVYGPSGDVFVRLEDGSGWLFETKGGIPALRRLHVDTGLFVYQVTNRRTAICLRSRPDFGLDYRIGADKLLRDGQFFVATARVRGEHGDRFVRVANTKGWVFETKDNHRTLTEIETHHVDCMYEVVHHEGIDLRMWPDLDEAYSTQPAVNVPCGAIVSAMVFVHGEFNDKFVLVNYEETMGWLFETKEGSRYLQGWGLKPPPIAGSEGSHVQLALGPWEGSWLLILDENDGLHRWQTHLWNNIPDDLARQLDYIIERKRRVSKLAVGSDGTWFLQAERYNGESVRHYWNQACTELARAYRSPKGLRQVALGRDTNDYGVVFERDGFNTLGLDGELLDEMHRAKEVQKLFLLRCAAVHTQDYFLATDADFGWRISNQWLREEVERNYENVCQIALGNMGEWVMTLHDRYLCSTSVELEMEQELANFFNRQRQRREHRLLVLANWEEETLRRKKQGVSSSALKLLSKEDPMYKIGWDDSDAWKLVVNDGKYPGFSCAPLGPQDTPLWVSYQIHPAYSSPRGDYSNDLDQEHRIPLRSPPGSPGSSPVRRLQLDSPQRSPPRSASRGGPGSPTSPSSSPLRSPSSPGGPPLQSKGSMAGATGAGTHRGGSAARTKKQRPQSARVAAQPDRHSVTPGKAPLYSPVNPPMEMPSASSPQRGTMGNLQESPVPRNSKENWGLYRSPEKSLGAKAGDDYKTQLEQVSGQLVLKVFVDAVKRDSGVDGGQTSAALGIIVKGSASGKVIMEVKETLGATHTLLHAKFKAVIAGLKAAYSLKATRADIYSDCKEVCNQIYGVTQPTDQQSASLKEGVLRIACKLNHVQIHVVSEGSNTMAARLANEALDTSPVRLQRIVHY